MKNIIICLLFFQLTIGFSQTLLSDLRPGMDGSEPDFEFAKQRGDELFFVANPDGQGVKLYKTDGVTITLLEEGSYVSYAPLDFLGDDLLYFSTDWVNQTIGIYKTNGTPGSGVLIHQFDTDGIAVPYWMNIVMDGVMYFYGLDQNYGYELWRTDGTTNGTFMVKDINPGVESSFLYTNNEAARQYFTELNGYIYFGAAEPVNGAELWRTDGTEAGTTMVANIEPTQPQIAQMGSNPAFFCTYNNVVYFSAYRSVDGRELWKTDGTSVGTVLVKDITSGDSNPSYMIEHNGSMYFSAYHPDQASTVYKSDGTAQGTNAVRAPGNGGPESPSSFVKFKEKLYFSGDYGEHVWYTDGSVAGTNFLPNGTLFNSTIQNLTATSNFLYFTASDDVNNKVYRTTDLPNQINVLTNASFSINTSYPLFLVNNCLLVRGDDGNTGDEIYTVCNQNTQPLGLEDLEIEKLVAFPNPCVDQVTISYDNSSTIERVILHSLTGNIIELPFNSNQTEISLNGLSKYSSGIYFLSIEMKNGQKYQVKVIIE